jgi:hypothetical protein
VIISPRWIKNVKWQEQTVTINHSKEAVNSPEYDSSQPLNDSTSIYSMSITKNKIIKIMEILQEAEVFEKTKMSNMSNSDRLQLQEKQNDLY